MSENLRNQPDGGYDNSGRSSYESREGNRHEEFEGMNYEQRRPAYNPQQTRTRNNDNNSEKGKRRDEL